MSSDYEKFWESEKYAVVGHSEKKKFPVLTYRGLKASGKTVFPIDGSADRIEGDKTFADFDALPEKVDAAILELPKGETKEWVEKAANAGIKNVWLHMNTDTPEAIEVAKEKGINLQRGTCAAMYVTPGTTFHSIHKFIFKIIGKY